jgi:hypothetical protein
MMKSLKEDTAHMDGYECRRGNEHIYQEINHVLPLVIYD